MRTNPKVIRRANDLPKLRSLGHGRGLTWTKAHERLLGLASDDVLAQIWETHPHRIFRHRQAIGKKPKGHGSIGILWTRPMLSELGTIRDMEFSVKYQISSVSVRIKRISLKIPVYLPPVRPWSAPMHHDLAVLSDVKMKLKYSLSREELAAKRIELAIPSRFHPKARPRPSRRPTDIR